MSPPIALALIFLILSILLVSGIPISFSLGVTSVVGILVFWDETGLFTVAASAYSKMSSFTFIAIPLFIYMAFLLQYSGIAEGLFQAMYRMMGRLRGGLAAGSVVIAAIFAGMIGISTVSTALIGTMGIPVMLKNGYAKTMAIGPICAGGALGILIPPSVIMIIYGVEAEESIGQLFMGGIIPGILLSGLFIIYILVRSFIRPNDAPGSTEIFTLKQKAASLKNVVLPLMLIGLVLGFIYFGIATPTESAAVGVVGALLCLLTARQFTRENIGNATVATIKLCGMILWIVIGAGCFNRIVGLTGITSWLAQMIADLEVNRWVILILMQFIFLFLGMIMDPAGIIMITTPIFIPIITALDFDTVWFGILFTINMEMSYITPPFGFNLFVIRAVVPHNVKTAEIYRSVIPFVFIQMICLAIVMIFPQIALWLPSTMISK